MATSEKKNLSDLSEQAVVLAEQLGRIAGSLQGKAESWLNRQDLSDQLTRVRDGATEMLASLASGVEQASQTLAMARRSKPARKKTPERQAKARGADPARAPGKRRRKPGPTVHGLKKSDEKIPKMRTAAAARQRRKSYA